MKSGHKIPHCAPIGCSDVLCHPKKYRVSQAHQPGIAAPQGLFGSRSPSHPFASSRPLPMDPSRPVALAIRLITGHQFVHLPLSPAEAAFSSSVPSPHQGEPAPELRWADEPCASPAKSGSGWMCQHMNVKGRTRFMVRAMVHITLQPENGRTPARRRIREMADRSEVVRLHHPADVETGLIIGHQQRFFP